PANGRASRDLQVDAEVALVVLEFAGRAEAEEALHELDLRVKGGHGHADVVVPLDVDHASSTRFGAASPMIAASPVRASRLASEDAPASRGHPEPPGAPSRPRRATAR